MWTVLIKKKKKKRKKKVLSNRVNLNDPGVVLVCVPSLSNDAVGQNRRWHLLLMVTPALGESCGQASSKENQTCVSVCVCVTLSNAKNKAPHMLLPQCTVKGKKFG